jgi:drug/metabolite transporter (DMT)-like permease
MNYLGEFSALLTAIFWTGGMISFAEATKRVGSVYVNVIRLILAFIFLSLTVVLGSLYQPISSSQAWFLLASGFIGFVFGDTFLFKSFEYTSARISSLVMSSAPAITAFLAYFLLNETLSAAGLIGMTVTLAGIALVLMEKKEEANRRMPVSLAGILYAFLGSVGQAGGMVLAKFAFSIGPINGFYATFIRVSGAVILLVLLNYSAGKFRTPVKVFSKDRRALGFTTLGAIFGPFLGVTFSLIAISNTKVGIAATIMATVPILMLPAVRIYYREKLSWRAVAGACIAVGGVAILFLR